MPLLTPENKKIDERFVSSSSLWGRFERDPSNNDGYQSVKAGISELRESVEKIAPGTEFESLWRDNLSFQLYVQDLLSDRYHGKPTTNVEALVDTACGQGTYNFLENVFRGHDDSAAWDLANRTEEIESGKIETTEDVIKIITAYLPEIRHEVIELGVSAGYFASNNRIRNFKLLHPGNSNGSKTYYDVNSGVTYFQPEEFDCFEPDDGALILSPVNAFKSAFHEVLGHVSSHINSKVLPKSLRLSQRTLVNIPSRVIYEGLGVQRESLVFEWLWKNYQRLSDSKKKVEISAGQIDLAEASFWYDIKYADFAVVSSVLNERAFFEKGFNIRKYLERLDVNQRIIQHFVAPVKSGYGKEANLPCVFSEAVDELCYAGYTIINDVYRGFSGSVEPQLLNVAMSTGVWSYKMYSKAVEYFLKNPEGIEFLQNLRSRQPEED